MGKNVTWVKLLVCLLFLDLVSALVLFYKYLLLALTYAVALISTDDFDRNALLQAVVETHKDSSCSAIPRAQKVSPTRDPGSLLRSPK
jgi:hypothetical protein